MEATGSKEINYFPNGVEVYRDNNLKRYYVVYDGVRIGEPQSSDMSDEEWEEILKGAAKL